MDIKAYIGKDEKALKLMLDDSTDFEERRKIRSALRDLRNKRCKTVMVYDTGGGSDSTAASALSGPSIPATCPPPQEAVLQAPATERVQIVRKAQSFKDNLQHANAENGSSEIHSRSAARSFLSKQLSFMAADNVNCLPLGTKPVERSQSVKLLASKFETKPQESTNSGLNGFSFARGDKKRNSASAVNQLKSASTVVETDQVVSSIRVGRTHSLKLSSGSSLSQGAPTVGSLAHSYNQRETRLLSGSDSDLSRSAGARFSSAWKERDVLVGNQRIRPFPKQQDKSQNSENQNSQGKKKKVPTATLR